jgi:hypothetical protein
VIKGDLSAHKAQGLPSAIEQAVAALETLLRAARLRTREVLRKRTCARLEALFQREQPNDCFDTECALSRPGYAPKNNRRANADFLNPVCLFFWNQHSHRGKLSGSEPDRHSICRPRERKNGRGLNWHRQTDGILVMTRRPRGREDGASIAGRSSRFFVVVALIYTILCCWVYVTGLRTWDGLLIDDAFITYRYAEYVAQGHGIVWNIGDERVEGYSSPLQLALLIPPALWNLDLLAVSKSLGILLHGFGVPLLILICIRCLPWGGPSPFRDLALLIPGAWWLFHPTVVHSISGMDTALAVFIYGVYALAIANLVGRGDANPRRFGSREGLVMVLAVASMLVRPEGGAIAFLGLAVLVAHRRTRRHGCFLVAGLVLVLAAYLSWKALYFGYVLPNPYYQKVDFPHPSILPGIGTVRNFLRYVPIFLSLIAFSFLAAPPSRAFPLSAIELVSLGGFGFYMVFVLWIVPIMGYVYRFNWHAMALLLFLAVTALHRISLRFRTETYAPSASLPSQLFTVAAVAALFVLLLVNFSAPQTLLSLAHPLQPPKARDFDYGGYGAHRRIGTILGQLQLPYDTIVSGEEAGLIPYLSGVRAIDLTGLSDNVITRGTPEEIRAHLDANPIDVNYSVSSSGALDDFGRKLEWHENDAEELRRYSRDRYLKTIAEYHYAGNYYWGTDRRRQEFVMWVRKTHPRALEITRSLRDGADFLRDGEVRFGPYEPEQIREQAVP